MKNEVKTTLEVVSHELKGIDFRSPKIFIDENGETQTQYAQTEGKGQPIDKIRLLYYLETEAESGELVDYFPIVPANNYLINLKINKNLKDTSSASNGLLQYFTKLLDWENQPWDHFPIRQANRPTYKFKTYLEDAVKSCNLETHLSPNTAKHYMNVVKNFYMHYMSKGFTFDNPPMVHEVLTQFINADASSMKKYRKIYIHSTDLRLRVARQKKDITERPLMALSDEQWDAVDNLVRVKRKVLKKGRNGRYQETSLSIEYALMCLVMRYVGLRREETNTLRENHIKLPTEREMKLNRVSVYIAPSNGIYTKNDDARTVKFPARLMKRLYEYIQSARHIKRRKKYENKTKQKAEKLKSDCDNKEIPVPKDKLSDIINEPTFLFLTNTGKPYSNDTLTSRWAEIRNTVQQTDPDFHHKQHNLRPTFAVSLLRCLINSGIKHGDALAELQLQMGHLDPDTTASYLKQATNAGSGHEISEHVTDYLFEMYEKEFDLEESE